MRNGSRTVLAAFAIVIVAGAGLAAAYMGGLLGPRYVRADDVRNVLIVAASPNDAGSVVGQIVVLFDLKTGAAKSISPALPVTIPGTSYDTLGDAYPFGGGRGTAEAYAQAVRADVSPYVALSAEDLESLVESVGGMSVDLPVEMSVFDGDKMYSLEAGEQRLNARELQAVLKGAPYLTSDDRASLDESLGVGLVEALAGAPGILQSADTDLAVDAVARLQSAL